MLLNIKAKHSSKKEEVIRLSDNIYKIFVKKPPIKGKANKAIISLLAVYFKVSTSKIRIVKGEKLRNKIIEIIK